MSPSALSAALLTQMLNLPPNLQSDGNVVAGLAAVQHGSLLSRSRGNGLVESVRNEQEVRTILNRGKDNMPEMRKRLKMDVEPDPGQRALSAVVSTPSIAGGPANAPLPASVLATGGCAGAGLMPLTINPAPPLITSGAVQPVPAPRQADGGRAEAAVAGKLRQKNDNNKEQKKRKRAQEADERAQAAADAAGCDDADELNLLVAQATEAGECTRPLLPTAKCDCKKCAAERKQKKDALNQQRQRRKS